MGKLPNTLLTIALLEYNVNVSVIVPQSVVDCDGFDEQH